MLGNLASRIAWVLMGKHKPTYDPAGESDAGDGKVWSAGEMELGHEIRLSANAALVLAISW